MPVPPSFRRLDANPIPASGTGGIHASLVVRNESPRLPYLLSYYRKLGVTRFFVTDNGSTDGGAEYLAARPDCHVFSTQESYAASRFGAAWHQRILDLHGGGRWWLMLDADEFLVYPGCEREPLSAFCAHLDSAGAEGLYTILLDMYPRGPLAEAHDRPGQDPLAVCPFFDSGYTFRPRPGLPFCPPFPRVEPLGGPRLRLFYPEFLGNTALKIAGVKILRKLRDALRKTGLDLPLPAALPPMLFKIPLFRFRPGLKIISSHVTSPLRLAAASGALLHFKFFSGFHAKALAEARRGEHFDGASEYGRYWRFLNKTDPVSFYCGASLEYAGSAQLAALGLIRDTAEWARQRTP